MSPAEAPVVEYTVKLVPVTPIHVWAGANAVVGLDAFVRGENLYVLTAKDLEQLPAADLEVAVSARRPEEALPRAFEALLARGLIKPLARVKASVPPRAEIRLLHEYIVPGSTLKGYVRTAVMRSLLSAMSSNQLVSAIRSGVDLSGGRKPAHVSEGLEASVFRKPRLRKQGGFVDAMELLLVSDPEIVERRLSVRRLYVVHRHNPSDRVAEILAVVLDPTEREALRYDVKVFTPRLAVERVFLNLREEDRKAMLDVLGLLKSFEETLSRRDFLLEALRNHGCALLELELRKVHESLVDYRRMLEELRKGACEKGASCVPARLGFMTGHEAKTVLDLVIKHTPDLYKDVASFMGQQVRRVWDALTLKLVDYEGRMLGVGWCKLCVE